MNTKSFNAGYKALNITLDTANIATDAVKYLPSAFCDLGNMVRSDVSKATRSVAGFFAGMRHASRVRSGKCEPLGGE